MCFNKNIFFTGNLSSNYFLFTHSNAVPRRAGGGQGEPGVPSIQKQWISQNKTSSL
jgi:hypothetical protein